MKAKNSFMALGCCVVFFASVVMATNVQAALRIFACEPEWAALAEALGGDQVQVFTATTAFQDPHHIEARPSLIAKARRSEMLICTGAELEIGWLPLLLRQSGNAAIQPGQPSHFLAAEEVRRLEVPQQLDRSAGDIHASGNPHVHLDPYRLLQIAESLTERLGAVDPENGAVYRANFADFSQRWQQAIRRWETKAAPLKGNSVVIQHRNFSYLLDWLGINVVADLEPKPGLPPSTSHLVNVLDTVNAQQPRAILLAAYLDDKPARWLADRSDLPVLRLPFTVGGSDTARDLFTLFDATLSQLLSEALPGESSDD